MTDDVSKDVGLQANLRPNSLDIKTFQPDLFPFDAFRFDDPNRTENPKLKMASPWNLSVGAADIEDGAIGNNQLAPNLTPNISIQSDSYEWDDITETYEGWALFDNGTANFAGDGTFKGVLSGATGTFSGDITADGTITGSTITGASIEGSKMTGASGSIGGLSTSTLDVEFYSGAIINDIYNYIITPGTLFVPGSPFNANYILPNIKRFCDLTYTSPGGVFLLTEYLWSNSTQPYILFYDETGTPIVMLARNDLSPIAGGLQGTMSIDKVEASNIEVTGESYLSGNIFLEDSSELAGGKRLLRLLISGTNLTEDEIFNAMNIRSYVPLLGQNKSNTSFSVTIRTSTGVYTGLVSKERSDSIPDTLPYVIECGSLTYSCVKGDTTPTDIQAIYL